MTNAINPPYVPGNPLNNNTYEALNPEKITGYITVSSKGTSNGLSDVPNRPGLKFRGITWLTTG